VPGLSDGEPDVADVLPFLRDDVAVLDPDRNPDD
jgi:hypothetical protein